MNHNAVSVKMAQAEQGTKVRKAAGVKLGDDENTPFQRADRSVIVFASRVRRSGVQH